MIGKLSIEEIEDVLKKNVLGRLGCHDMGKTYVVPISYVYDGRDIIAHSVNGMKIEMMRNNPRVCFEVDEMENLRNWRSVIVWGTYQELNDERDRYKAMKIFVDRMMYMKISDSALPPEATHERTHPRAAGFKPVIYRIIISEKTGRYEME